MRRIPIILSAIFLLLMSTSALLAQKATPEATPEAETQSTGEILAGLPQSRTSNGGFVAGDETASITLVEFVDFDCSHCQDYKPVIDQVVQQYVATGKAKFELRIYPTAGGDMTYYAGELAECANHQRAGDYWRAYDLLYQYAERGQYDESMGSRLADDLNLNADKLDHCVATAKQVSRDITLASEFSVSGTPTVMVRYGDGSPQYISTRGQSYRAGGIPLDVLTYLIDGAQPIIN